MTRRSDSYLIYFAATFLLLAFFLFLGQPLLQETQRPPTLGSTHSSSSIQVKSYSHGDHSPFLPPEQQCTEEQRNAISYQLGLDTNKVRVVGCQNDDWLDKFYEEEADIGTESFVGISIGCNKGDDAIHTARMGMSDPKFDNSAWKAAIGGLDGVCPEHHNQLKEIRFPKRRGEMHCVEAMPANFQLLHTASQVLGLDSEQFVVVNAALAARSGAAKFPDGAAGKEDLQLTQCAQSKEFQERCAEVDMYSLSDYVEKFVQSKGPINSLSIDTEGLDFEVLFGAGPVLDRTMYLEFEYHNTGVCDVSYYLLALMQYCHVLTNHLKNARRTI